MKKKKLMISLLAIACLATSAFALSSCESEKGEQGIQGEAGKSAYQIWLDNGHSGTETDFLNWLKADCNDNNNNNEEQCTVGLHYQPIAGKDEYRVIGLGLASRGDIIIPSAYKGLPVTEIGANAFEGETYLMSIKIPDSVISIGSHAFSNCKDLTEIIIPDSVSTIGDSAFYDCDGLTGIAIPDSVTTIGSSAFSDCENLTSVVIGDSVTTIGSSAFSDCENLTSVVIGDSVTSIASFAFANCSSLTSITIPDSVTLIGERVFSRCRGLSIYYVGNIATWCNILFHGPFADLTTGEEGSYNLYINNRLVIDSKFIVNFQLPNNLTEIKSYAFFKFRSLTSVEIPDGVTTIGDSAFAYCNSLRSIIIPDSVTSIGEEAFYFCYVLSVYYKGTARDWENISIDSYSNYHLIDATRYYYIENEADVPTDGGNYWHYNENGEIEVWA